MLSRRTFLAALAAARKPNFILILADDMGYGDIGCYGSKDVPTPHLDALARDGVRFTDGYVSCAVCSPSRAALLTGRYQHRFGHEFNSGPLEREAEINFGLPASETILPALLRPAGYRSIAIGKWHLGARPGFHPLDRGFDEFYGFLTGGNAFLTPRTPGRRLVASDGDAGRLAERSDPIRRGREPVAEDRYLTDAFAAEALRFIETNRTRPFFLYLAPNAIHTPLHTLEKYLNRVPAIANEKHRLLAAMTVALDDTVGLITAKLRELNLERDTLLVFLSDNGCPVVTGAGANAPLNGEKVTYFEGGIRVPFLMRWPGRLPAGAVYREPVVSRDLAPTLLAAAGLPVPPLDGVNLLPLLRPGAKPAPRTLFWRAGQARAVRRGPWKLVEFGNEFTGLYNLADDLGETRDRSREQPALLAELRAAWAAWSRQMGSPAWPPRHRKLTVNGRELNWEL
jgi:arylsulfatase A-like enzyme